MTERPRVLVSEGASGQSRAALAAVRALAKTGYEPHVTMSGPLSLAGASRYCRRRIRVPEASSDPAGYARAIRREVARYGYLAVLPASDAALIALDLPVDRFLDKAKCAQLARQVGLAVPPTEVFESHQHLLDSANRLPYPVVVKPAIKHFAARRIEGPADLKSLPQATTQLLVQPFLGDQLHGILGLAWNGRLLATVHLEYLRIWPLPCGTVAAAQTLPPDHELEEKLEQLVAGYNGLLHADLAGDYLLDLNPRVHATLPVAVAAGANLVAMYCDLLRGREVAPRRGREGILFRHREGDLRSIAHLVRRGKLTARQAFSALRPRRGTVHSVGSLRDPLPMAARVGFAAMRIARHGQRGEPPRIERG